MVDCDYCGASFDGEDAYLDHLAADHEGELGAIDRRRVENRTADEGGDGIALGPVVIGVVVALGLGLTAFVVLGGGGDGPSVDGIEGAPLNESGDADRLSAVERFPSQGTDHVAAGTEIDYARVPPLSGTHYGGTVDAGFYETTPALGDLVHTLEHGAVVVYYDPAATTDAANESLREFAAANTGTWRSVVVAPNPNADPAADYVLTAWRHRLYMDGYDARTVHAFLSEFLGRGPENPVR
ncbi:DUF3105 domain-containing protein [Haloarcula litorea]|uniref:DUF3105 domain-containing protein n=1 Tax=Haloarcula litorea TaxID=3032579 RepID=UPI0023E8710F|nr:DUF3105 domain-containing protein [Halomicroarcula sp. GDY20]